MKCLLIMNMLQRRHSVKHTVTVCPGFATYALASCCTVATVCLLKGARSQSVQSKPPVAVQESQSIICSMHRTGKTQLHVSNVTAFV